MTHPPTPVLVPRSEKAERRVWTLLAALFALVGSVNGLLAATEAAWWQAVVAILFLGAAGACARAARRSGA
ncbi:hypothetical protein [Saccharothrix syringae]|uniref:DUF1275 domain-containing protein n=1 Tax=Saccharothrix syringae TaxID=103733 RepID=A0A5Q0GZF3_SACSY|nr:hypothetical protein [Saccharothrix syringae]QFZ19328.1 hypothetical protein EKG83_19490 [Saccharothrix syringae]